MSPCLVQQLFRQKIGKELDQGIVDDVLFPLLRPRKHPSKELLQDIKLATDTLIGHIGAGLDPSVVFNIPIFTPLPAKGDWIVDGDGCLPVSRGDDWGGENRGRVSRGRRTSKWQRQKIRTFDWGTIDILNELRGLNYPRVGYKPRPYVIEEPDSFDDAYISLAEDNSLPATIRWGVDHSLQNAVLIDSRSQFVNNILDDVLITGKRLTWSSDGTPWGILSIVESSQHGEVLDQLN